MRQDDFGAEEVIRRRSPEGALLASIFLTAHQDAGSGAESEAIPAYEWVVQLNPHFVRYCELLDMDPGRFRSAFIRIHSKRCEKFMRLRMERWSLARIAADEERSKEERQEAKTKKRQAWEETKAARHAQTREQQAEKRAAWEKDKAAAREQAAIRRQQAEEDRQRVQRERVARSRHNKRTIRDPSKISGKRTPKTAGAT